MRDAATLDKEVAQLKAQADALHHAYRDAIVKDLGAIVEEGHAVRRQLAAEKRTAEIAEKHVKEINDKTDKLSEEASRKDAEADKLLADGGDRVRAQELQEEAHELRAQRLMHIKAGEDAARAAMEAKERVRALEADDDKRLVALDDARDRVERIENAADQIDEKVRLLEDAAKSLRTAGAEDLDGNVGGAAGSRNYAAYAIEKADAIEPDFRGIDPAVLNDAGIKPVADDTVGDLSTMPEPAAAAPIDALVGDGAEPVRDELAEFGEPSLLQVEGFEHEPVAAAEDFGSDMAEFDSTPSEFDGFEQEFA